jgi:hypothetical protein
MSQVDMKAELERLQAENAALKAAQAAKQVFKLKVSEKGAISIYGMSRTFPVTLYRGQMERLLDNAPQIRAFIAENASKLSVKPTKE